MITIFDFFKKIFGKRDNDPVYYCDFYKEYGCPHIDGVLCEMKTCDTLIRHKNNEIFCPVCGYYCLGKGKYGCIDKPNLV